MVGSRAYGLAEAASDVDRRGVYAAPTPWFWGFDKPPTSVEGPEPERLSWEVEHFCLLALKANPTALEPLASPLVEVCAPLGAELRELLPAFLSRAAAASYAHTADRQLARATTRDGVKWKQVMHALRLLDVAVGLLRTGELDLAADRAALLPVRAGEVPMAECLARADRLRADLAAAVPKSPLPDAPDTARVRDWLVSVRRRCLDDPGGA